MTVVLVNCLNEFVSNNWLKDPEMYSFIVTYCFSWRSFGAENFLLRLLDEMAGKNAASTIS